MQTNLTLRKFWHQLETADEAVLLLDYDGTLAPFTVVRDQALPYTGVLELLADIERNTRTRLIIITGRAINDLLPLLNLQLQPEVWGCHGWEWLDAKGNRILFELPGPATVGLEEAQDLMQEMGLLAMSEVKPVSVAVHWRGLDEGNIEALSQKTRNLWEPIAKKYQLEIHPFSGGLELRVPGKNKGTAISTILQDIEAGIPIAFLGDDLTDEDGFDAIGGRGIGILVNSECRESKADHRVEPPQGLINFLLTWRDKAPQKNRQ